MDNRNSNYAKSIFEISKEIQNGEILVEDLVNVSLNRIRLMDKQLNSFITVNNNALKEAKKIDKEIQEGNYKGTLHGIPIGLKDLIETKNLRTTMGSKIYENYIASEDSKVVEKLKDAGAIIIGKLNTHQFAYGPTGDRSYYGPVKNPYDQTRMTGGSSSGAGAAVAAGLCYAALGTDTGGSIRIPAAFCGIVGMKPTYGTISKQGVYPLSWNLDHVGPMTRTIYDNAILLNVLAGYDENDSDSIKRQPEDFTRLIGENVEDLVIGVPNQFYLDDLDSEIESAVQLSLKQFEDMGVKLLPVDLSEMEKFNEAHKIILRNDSYANHEHNLNQFPDYWDEEVKERLMTALDDKGYEYARARRFQQISKQIFNKALRNVDALLTPTMSIMPPKINERHIGPYATEENHIRWSITKLTSPSNLNGFPSLSLPCGFSADRMPIGIQLIGKELEEAKLYQLGYALEQKLSLNMQDSNSEVFL